MVVEMAEHHTVEVQLVAANIQIVLLTMIKAENEAAAELSLIILININAAQMHLKILELVKTLQSLYYRQTLAHMSKNTKCRSSINL